VSLPTLTPDTVDTVLRRLPPPPAIERIPAPKYTGTSGERRTFMAVKSMENHTTDEGWQLSLALGAGGYSVTGYGIGECQLTDAVDVVTYFNSSVLVLQDKREWQGKTAGSGFDQREQFTRVSYLSSREDIFVGTILKDAQHNPEYHRQSAEEIGANFWVCYYHPQIVCHLAPYVRQEHVVRTYHTVDVEKVPAFRGARERNPKSLLSGAVSGAYPLRQRLMASRTTHGYRRVMNVLPHPGYGRTKCYTPEYLQQLSQYRVAICTSSVYGYALRKIVEATACGCVVITDLPVDDPLPGIDGNSSKGAEQRGHADHIAGD
jgi:hypothetical protein